MGIEKRKSDSQTLSLRTTMNFEHDERHEVPGIKICL